MSDVRRIALERIERLMEFAKRHAEDHPELETGRGGKC